MEINSPNAYPLTEKWGWSRRTCGACPSSTDPQVQPTRMALHAARLAGGCYQRLCQPHLCCPVQPNSWGEGDVVSHALIACNGFMFWRCLLNCKYDLCVCRLLPFVTWMNRGSRSTGYVFCFASWLWLVSFPSFYRFASVFATQLRRLEYPSLCQLDIQKYRIHL